MSTSPVSISSPTPPLSPMSDHVVNTVISIITEESGIAVTLDSSLINDAGLDSLDFVNVGMCIESEFKIGPVPDSDLFRLHTVEQVVRYVEAWLATKASTATANV